MGLLHSFGHRWISKAAANSEERYPISDAIGTT